jgi:hypothetical protein
VLTTYSHLLGKKSWNVYNPANIARVKADEAAAAAREAADDQRMQELDAERRAAILRGQTPPPLPEEEDVKSHEGQNRKSNKDRDGHDRKRRRLAGEDDTDRDMRLAKSMTGRGEDDNSTVFKLRKPKSDAPLTDHAGNINLFPVNVKEAVKREKNEEAEREKKKKEQALEDQYTMRLSNAGGNGGLEQHPWYASKSKAAHDIEDDRTIEYPELENKDVWGREDPRRKEREKARVSSNDPLAFMKKAQVQLKRSKEDRKKWAEDRNRELRELQAVEEREHRTSRHSKHKRRTEEDDFESFSLDNKRHERHSKHKHRHRNRSRSRSHERRQDNNSSHRYDRKYEHHDSRERDHRHQRHSSHRRHRSPDHETERSGNIRHVSSTHG